MYYVLQVYDGWVVLQGIFFRRITVSYPSLNAPSYRERQLRFNAWFLLT